MHVKINTKTVHLGQDSDPQTGSVNPPVYFTSTYEQESPGNHKGYDYARAIHPNRVQLETALSGLECGKYAIAFASGCAAATAVLSTLKPGDHVLATQDLYGGTYRLFMEIFKPWGLEFSFVSEKATSKEINLKIKKNTRLIWLETPTNPLLHVYEIKRFVNSIRKRSIKIMVDNTFATPMLQNPLIEGADIVLHSTTKYMGGHSDVLGGALILNDTSWEKKLRIYQKSTGAIPGPMDCYLLHRGLKTLALRMQAHCANAHMLKPWLTEHPKVKKIYFPKPSSQMKLGGGMISFELNTSASKVNHFFKKLKLIRLAESLGGVESLICHPTTMTHSAIPESQRKRLGITPQLIRLSVGIESWDDIKADLNTALKGI
jgi:cystathionine gamma-lyase